MTDVNGTINFVNAAFEDVYGYKKEEVVGKMTPLILKSGVMKKKFYIKLEKALKEQEINQQRQIVEATISGQEKEKNELGKELHDNINQVLATVKYI